MDLEKFLSESTVDLTLSGEECRLLFQLLENCYPDPSPEIIELASSLFQAMLEIGERVVDDSISPA